MQIFYYISMKCVQNDYLVLPLEWGGNRAEWGGGKISVFMCLLQKQPLPLKLTFLWTHSRPPAHLEWWGCKKNIFYPRKTEDMQGKSKPPKKRRDPTSTPTALWPTPPATDQGQHWLHGCLTSVVTQGPILRRPYALFNGCCYCIEIPNHFE